MEIKILGPLSAEVYGRSIVPSAAKPRQILALLAIYANQVMPVPTLMEEIWGDDMPRSALTTLQTYILQLRRLLRSAYGDDPLYSPKEVLATRHGGYVLEVQPGSVDVHEYDDLVVSGRAAVERGDDEAAATLYRDALALWRGGALVDVRVGPLLEVELVRLEESRLGVLERRIDADLRLGRHLELLAELTSLTARHPLHEGIHAQCMVALYRSGQQWRALEVFQSLRGALADELGLDPSPRLRRIHHAILAGDPALESPAAVRRPTLDLFAA